MPHQPCPFCGGDPVCESGQTFSIERTFFAQVFCRICQAQAEFAREATREAAVLVAWERWDRRVPRD